VETPSIGVSRNIKAGRFAMLYCISANYTPKAMQAMAKKPDTNRRDAVEKLVKAAGGKLVAMYGTMVDGPGAMVIVDVDPGVGAANDDLLTGRTAGLLKLYSLFADADHFLHREQTLCLDVTNAIG
jgi:uncharacterized protein with GYD domain